MIVTTITPWLSICNDLNAVDFYKAAFRAIEVYRLDDPGGGSVVKLSVEGAEFWLSIEATDKENLSPASLGGNSIRMILTVEDPDAFFNQALKSGAVEIFPVGEEHGWKLGRLADPFGFHWEIGHPLTT